MNYNFIAEDKIKIIQRFGNVFFNHVDELVEGLALKWGIDELQLINSFSAGLIFKGLSVMHGPIIMKFGIGNEAFISEVEALQYFGESCSCKLLDVDFDNRVLLEEWIQPGDELVSEHSLEKRLDVFCDLYQQLHRGHNNPEDRSDPIKKGFKYKSYRDWIFKITAYMEKEKNWDEVTAHMQQAKALFLELSQEYKTESLLHGDFHYYNILKGKNGYKVIDPKGVIGNPIFDIPRYMLNEFWDEEDKTKIDKTIEQVLDTLSDRLNLSKSILGQLIYIEGAMAICWCVESGADIEEKADFLVVLNKLESYMKIQ